MSTEIDVDQFQDDCTVILGSDTTDWLDAPTAVALDESCSIEQCLDKAMETTDAAAQKFWADRARALIAQQQWLTLTVDASGFQA